MRRMLPAYIAALMLVWLSPISATAQTTINGNLSGTLGPGTYIVNGNCQVPAGQSLTINPGTTFLHTGHFTWTIQGEITAVGTPTSTIVFTHQTPSMLNKWGGIRFQAESSSSSTLEWCEFLWSMNGGSPYSDGGAIYVDEVPVLIRNCVVNNCHASGGGAIYLSHATGVVIDSCTINNNFASNGGGIYLNYSHNIQITNCTIANNSSTST